MVDDVCHQSVWRTTHHSPTWRVNQDETNFTALGFLVYAHVVQVIIST
jgi:hypothetical protein